MNVTWNPLGLDLDKLDWFLAKFDVGDERELSEPYIYVREYNKIPGDRIVAWQVGWLDEDFSQNKVTYKFYVQ